MLLWSVWSLYGYADRTMLWYAYNDINEFQIFHFCFKLLGLDQMGLGELVTESIKHCEADRRGDMSGNIIMAGSNTMIRGKNIYA